MREYLKLTKKIFWTASHIRPKFGLPVNRNLDLLWTLEYKEYKEEKVQLDFGQSKSIPSIQANTTQYFNGRLQREKTIHPLQSEIWAVMSLAMLTR